MELENCVLKARRLFTTASAQQLIDSRVPLPEGKTAVTVLSAACAIRVTEAVCAGALVKTAGELTLTLLIVGEDGEPYSFTALSAFTHRLELDAVTDDMEPEVSAQLLECECMPEDGGVRLTAVAELEAAVFLGEETQAVRAIHAPGVETKETLLTLSRRTVLARGQLRMREEINAPSAVRVLSAQGAACVDSVAVTGSGASVEGQLHVTLLTENEHGQLAVLNAILPFRDALETQCLSTGAWGEAEVSGLTAVAADAGFGVCDLDAVLDITVYGAEASAQTLLADAYDAAGSFGCRCIPMTLYQCRGQVQKKERVSENVLIPRELPEAYRPVSAVVLPAVTGVDGDAGRLSVDVMLLATMVYQCDGGYLHSFHEDIPLRLELDAPYLPQTRARVKALSAQLGGGGRTLALYAELLIAAELNESQETQLCVGLDGEAPATQGRGVFVYCAGAGETMWSVGKRFGVPAARLAALNEGLTDPLPEGKQLLIMK